MITFGDKVRSTRQEAGVTQIELAERVGITQAALSHIETGTRTTSPATARAICAVLELDAPWPAVAGIEHVAAADARERGITLEQAYIELVSDLAHALT